ncbi:MAG TPA: hypothetical protein VIH60_03940 [Steroidobacteraceae bacterium]
MNKFTIAAAALAAGLLAQTQGFTQVPVNPSISASTAADTATTSDPEKAQRKMWRAVIRNTPVPGGGCFHVSYPDVAWQRVECKEAKPRVHHASRRPAILAPAYVGDNNDWIAGSTQGLIIEAHGHFFLSGVTSETNVTTNSSPSGAITGPNDYSLQINTNRAYTSACEGHVNCTVWQQFIYATNSQQGESYLFMQYWLYNWGNNCPSNWWHPTGDTVDCYTNSQEIVTSTVIPVTDLGNVMLQGWASPTNGTDFNDCVFLDYGGEWFNAVCAASVLDIGSVWTHAEFNVVGDLDSTQAQFNPGSQITVQLGIDNISNNAPPVCLLSADVAASSSFPGPWNTAETNNLTLGACQTGVGPVVNGPYSFDEPYIEFTENHPIPSTPCLSCGGGGNPLPPTPPIRE